MFSYIKFENYRGFKQLEMSDLKQINLISGKNNAGKSSILEGIFLFNDHTSTESFVKINNFRALPVISYNISLWEAIFYQMNTKLPLTITASYETETAVLEYIRDDGFLLNDINMKPDIINQFISSAKSSYTLHFSYQKGDYRENGHFSISPSGIMRNIETSNNNSFIEPMPYTYFINRIIETNDNSIVDWFGRLELEGKKHQVINALKLIDSSIFDVCTISQNGLTQLYAKINNQLLPLKLAGDGLNRLLFLILAIIENPGAIFLIDEIETGFHYSVFNKIWEVISKIAKSNSCQIFATTHSYECIAGAIEGVKLAKMEEDFSYYRIDKTIEDCKAYRFSNDLLDKAISSEMEVR